jgi:tetratricopeptide (TPR) repeat protein
MREAEQSYRKALELEPRMSGAWRAIAEMKTFHTLDSDLDAMMKIYESRGIEQDIRKNIAFALGKANEDLGDYERAFAFYQEGNRIHRENSKFDVRHHVNQFRQTRRVFETRRMQELSGSGYRDPTPIFILGMPRSGTTLTEQILASHREIEGGGERYDLSKIVGRASEVAGVTGQLVDWIDKIDSDGLRKLGQAYIDALRREYPEVPHVTDKMPGNFRFVGLIHAILPDAKIIHTRRHPGDTCMSCFTKLFTDSQDFTYDLTDLGRYYRAYEELMAHWRAILPAGAMLDVEYERLVADVEGQTRRILDFVGLPWDENCLRFFENKRGVATASQTQVRQPIYKTSVQRWRNYRSQLQPLFRAMASGYEESGPE